MAYISNQIRDARITWAFYSLQAASHEMDSFGVMEEFSHASTKRKWEFCLPKLEPLEDFSNPSKEKIDFP